MIGQLDRLLTIISLSRVQFGILPAHAEYRVPTNQFIIFDERMVHIETVTAELAITQPREITLYLKAFEDLAQHAVYGLAAKNLITDALTRLRSIGQGDDAPPSVTESS